MRIVSLLPSATEILFALGVGDQVVGVTHECDHPPEVAARTAVTRDLLPSGLSSAEIDAAVSAGIRDAHTIYALDVDALAALAPDLVVAQELCDVCAVPVDAVTATVCARTPGARVVAADPVTLDELADAVRAIGEAAGAGNAVSGVVEGLTRRLTAVERAVGGRARPGVAVLEWPDPPWLPGHWVPDMVARAGGHSLLGASGQPSRRGDWDALARLDADVVVAAFCGLDLQATIEAVAEISDRPQWRALTQGARLVAIDGSAYISRPGPRLVDGVELLAWVVHGVGDRPAPGRVAVADGDRWRDPGLVDVDVG